MPHAEFLSSHLDFNATLGVLGAAVLFFILWQKRKLFSEPKIFFPDISAFDGKVKNVKFAKIPQQLLSSSLIAFTLAFIDPHVFVERNDKDKDDDDLKMPIEGIGIYLILDQSGSMKEKVSQGSGRTIPKVDLLRTVTKEFIAGDAVQKLPGRPNDMIGLVAFARGAHVLSPLTLDHAAVLQELDRFAPIGVMNEDGTSIGYAIFKTASMIAATRHYAEELKVKGKPAYTMKQVVMILITDGLQDPNPLDKGKRLRNMDVPEAAAYAKEQNIRLYIVNVEPKLATEQFAPYRHMMQRAAETTGGKFFMIDNTANLKEIYSDIDRMEKSYFPVEAFMSHKADRPDLYKRVSIYPYLIALGLIFLFTGLMLDSTVLRRIP